MINLTHNEYEGQRGALSAHPAAAADGVSDWVLAPSHNYPLTITVHPGNGGTARCEFTTSPLADVVAGTALWQPWGLANVGVLKIDMLASPVVAIRLVAIGAEAKMDVVAGR
jgi:hypothetical protein